MSTNNRSSIVYLLIGTYTPDKKSGLYLYEFNLDNGDAKYISQLDLNNPSYFTTNREGNIIYAVSEEESKYASAVSTIKVDKSTGEFTLLNSITTEGASPCYISIDDRDKYLVTANYLGGSISVFNLDSDHKINQLVQQIKFDGKSVHPERQNQSHIHCVKYSPSYKHLFATDLGTDKVYKFDIHPDNKDYLVPSENSNISVEPGFGPRHLIFDEKGHAYLIGELSGEVKVFDLVDDNLVEIQTVTSQYNNAEGSADIQIHPNGQFLYTSNRLEDDGLTIFRIDQESGKLNLVGEQKTELHPRNFLISPYGKYVLVASKDSHVIQVFSVDQRTGLLTDLKKDIDVHLPVCIKFI